MSRALSGPVLVPGPGLDGRSCAAAGLVRRWLATAVRERWPQEVPGVAHLTPMTHPEQVAVLLREAGAQRRPGA